MCTSITRTLYECLKQKRLMAAVAQRMGIPHSTLAAELQGEKFRAKLGADELIPLFRAIREVEGGAELDGILKKFVRELQGEEVDAAAAEEFGQLLFGVIQGIGVLSQSAAQIESLNGRRELAKLKTKIRGEIIPAVYKLEDIIDSRLSAAVRPAKAKRTDPSPAPQTI